MRLSKVQDDALHAAKDHGELARYPGGFWSARGVEKDRNGLPVWHFGTNTIYALLRRGRLVARETMLRGDPLIVAPAENGTKTESVVGSVVPASRIEPSG